MDKELKINKLVGKYVGLRDMDILRSILILYSQSSDNTICLITSDTSFDYHNDFNKSNVVISSPIDEYCIPR